MAARCRQVVVLDCGLGVIRVFWIWIVVSGGFELLGWCYFMISGGESNRKYAVWLPRNCKESKKKKIEKIKMKICLVTKKW